MLVSDSKAYKNKLKTMLNKITTLEPLFVQQGATKTLIDQLADATESKITVYEVVSQKKVVSKASKVARKFHFKFQNISYNHVELWSGKNEEKIVENIGEQWDRLVSNQ